MRNLHSLRLVCLLCGVAAFSCSSDKDKETDTEASAEAKPAAEAKPVEAKPVEAKPVAAKGVEDVPTTQNEPPAVPSIDAGAQAKGEEANGGEEASGGEEAHGGEEGHVEIPFEKHYSGRHKLGVNRVNSGKRTGKGRIFREVSVLVLDASVKEGPYSLQISGIVTPISKTEFSLEGRISGTPNLNYKDIAPAPQTTEGTFLFKATKGRKFWRLYEVDGKECVCDDNCGNDFCYIDLGF